MTDSFIKNSFKFADKVVNRVTIPIFNKVETVLQGNYKSILYGHGLDFKEIREYTEKDDIRNIDWNVTARTGRPFVKTYQEEKELIIWIIIDLSPSMLFGSKELNKKEIAIQFASIIAYLAFKNGDKVGAIILNKNNNKIISPARGLKQVYRVVQEFLNYDNTSFELDTLSLNRINKVLGKKKQIFFISDFIFNNFEWEKGFGEICLKNNVSPIQIIDPVEESIPDSGYLRLMDYETGKYLVIDTSNKSIRDEYKKLVDNYNNQLFNILKKSKVEPFKIYTDSDLTKALIDLYQNKSKYKNTNRR